MTSSKSNLLKLLFSIFSNFQKVALHRPVSLSVWKYFGELCGMLGWSTVDLFKIHSRNIWPITTQIPLSCLHIIINFSTIKGALQQWHQLLGPITEMPIVHVTINFSTMAGTLQQWSQIQGSITAQTPLRCVHVTMTFSIMAGTLQQWR